MNLSDYDIYFTVNGASKHVTPISEIKPTNGNAEWNEKNQGFGLTAKKTNSNTTRSLGVGQYLNSLGDNSNYLIGGLQKRLLGNNDLYLDAGGRAGLLTGYGPPVLPMGQVLLTLGNKDMGVNLGWNPHVPDVTPEVYMLNFDYKLPR